eukprot:4297008-Lingulodinium_polyedra.AAC.1
MAAALAGGQRMAAPEVTLAIEQPGLCPERAILGRRVALLRRQWHQRRDLRDTIASTLHELRK